ncbi:MAG: SUMF1/EgtB/PvdO family nonheme iron enzyme, partial [Burkholderiales bacterium]|nr:SUMF1/EgtB/PvdO family nonheme iron enzyme [Burkholderiales bacterium]
MFRDCDNCPEMVVVPAGQYGFGSPPNEFGSPYNEGYVLDVRFAKPFAIGKYEVTFEEWNQCVKASKCVAADDDSMGGGRRPVVNVNWDNAAAFLQWLSERTGKPYRLPS